jgi:NitT/TauT family transport system permease protein
MRTTQPQRHLRDMLPPVVFLVLVLVGWEAVTQFFKVPVYLLPAPSLIARAAIDHSAGLVRDTLTTLFEAVAGFCLANILGLTLAVVFAYSKTFERAVYPYAIALKTTPIVALAPLLVLWLGTGIGSKIVCSAVICFFPILVNATRGLRDVDEEALDLFRSLAATGPQTFFKLRLPHALPAIFSALKISSSLSIVGSIVGEFVGAQAGLGYLIIVSSYHLESDMMFAAVLAAAACGVAFFVIVSLCERWLVPWSDPSED